MKRHFQSDAVMFGVSFISRHVPLAVLTLALSRYVVAMRSRHPEILERMGPYATKSILINPTDLPLALLLLPSNAHPASAIRLPGPCKWDACISGSIAALFAMVQGSRDGDALFFSRDIKVEGSADVVLALRNAIDASELDLLSELFILMGPIGNPAAKILRTVLSLIEKSEGLGTVDVMRQPL